MTIVIFTEGTILMHKGAVGHGREEIVQQVVNDEEPSLRVYAHYVPIDNAVTKIKKWADQGAQIVYMSSRRSQQEVDDIRNVLSRHNFPQGIVRVSERRRRI